MRFLPLIKEDGTIEPCPRDIVRAHMLDPEDELERAYNIAAERAWHSAGSSKVPDFGKFMDGKLKSAAEGGGTAAALILFDWIQFNHHFPDLRVGIRKARFFHWYDSKIRLKLKTARTETVLKENWLKYKNVAHLWAALLYRVHLNSGTAPNQIHLAEQLEISEQIACIAFDLGLQDWNPWRTPPGVNLWKSQSAGNVPIPQVIIPKPDAEDIRNMRRYRASGKHEI